MVEGERPVRKGWEKDRNQADSRSAAERGRMEIEDMYRHNLVGCKTGVRSCKNDWCWCNSVGCTATSVGHILAGCMMSEGGLLAGMGILADKNTRHKKQHAATEEDTVRLPEPGPEHEPVSAGLDRLRSARTCRSYCRWPSYPAQILHATYKAHSLHWVGMCRTGPGRIGPGTGSDSGCDYKDKTFLRYLNLHTCLALALEPFVANLSFPLRAMRAVVL